MGPIVSIITPVYNSSKSIGRYFRSITGQTYPCIEAVIVDDHGSDGAIDNLRQLAESYTGPVSFRFMETPENSGPGAARNLGIDAAEGKYIAFVDSDDEIDPKFCECLVESAERNNSDLCCCNIAMYDEKRRRCSVRKNPPFPDGEFSGENRKKFLKSYVSYFTTFLYTKAFFEKYRINFPSNRNSEDSALLCYALLCCKRMSHVDASLYHYMRMAESLSTARDSSRYLQRLDSLGSLIDSARARGWYEKDGEELDFIYFKKGFLMAVFDYIADNRPARPEVISGIVEVLDSKIPDYRQNTYIRSSVTFSILDSIIRKAPRLAVPLIRAYRLIRRGE